MSDAGAGRPSGPGDSSLSGAAAKVLRPIGVIDWTWIAARRARIFGVAAAELRRQRAFFTDLDFHCNQVLLPFNAALGRIEQYERLGHVTTLVAYLAKRVHHRVRGQAAAAEVSPAVSLGTRELSRLQLGLLRQHFGDGRGGVDLPDVRGAFERFANGGLRLGADGSTPGKGGADGYLTLDCEPSGDFYFLFGEFALAAIELDVDAAEWTALAPILVSTQEIMSRAYRPPPGQRRIGQYSSVHYDANHEHRFDAAETAALRARYDGLSISELAGAATRNARAAYCDEPQGRIAAEPQPKP